MRWYKYGSHIPICIEHDDRNKYMPFRFRLYSVHTLSIHVEDKFGRQTDRDACIREWSKCKDPNCIEVKCSLRHKTFQEIVFISGKP